MSMSSKGGEIQPYLPTLMETRLAPLSSSDSLKIKKLISIENGYIDEKEDAWDTLGEIAFNTSEGGPKEPSGVGRAGVHDTVLKSCQGEALQAPSRLV